MFTQDIISILIPTYNEADNMKDTLERIIGTFDNINTNYEILVIDDASEDDTVKIAGGLLAQKKGSVISRLCIRSLSLSVLDGIKQSKGNIIIVMDADGSHPPELIPLFIKDIQEGYDLVIASRYIEGGGSEGLPLLRKIMSRFACLLGRAVTKVKDNTSGFFCVRKSALEGISLTPSGFKIGLEIFVKANINSFKEIPYTFTNRKRGESKLRIKACMQYLYQIFSLLAYKITKI
ncbi:polyprenol monophosphomannose synthase [Candidatus Omnitrophota bacterium]